MATGTLAPSPWLTVLDDDGNPVSGAKIYTYVAGTTTLVATYTDVDLLVANANPIVADAAGRYVAFLSPGSSYKFIVKTSADVVIRTQDDIGSVPATSNNLDILGRAGEALTAGKPVYLSDGTGGLTAGSWYFADTTPGAYASTSPIIGFAPADIASGATGAIRLGGVITGLSSLTVGAWYYIGSTPGTITATVPSLFARRVGMADTTSSLAMDTARRPMLIGSSAAVDVNDWNIVAGLIETTVNWGGAASITVTGLSGGEIGQKVTFINTSASSVMSFTHNTVSTVGNRFYNVATSGPTPIAVGGSATYVYNGTFWILTEHEQGAWITMPYSAANFTATTGTWGVDADDEVVRYRLDGRTLTVELNIASTDVSANTANLFVTMPYTFTTAGVFQLMRVSDAGAAVTVGMAIPSGGTAKISLWGNVAGAGFTLTAADNTTIQGVFQSDVT